MKKQKNRLFVDEKSYIEYVMEGNNIIVYKVHKSSNGSFLMRRIIKIYK
ncbi:MAG: hypothetical protein KAU31_17550 [Spirochaetaceae bacterium]|nr:hypothetical protein [Spirochaetaceae bacterium]